MPIQNTTLQYNNFDTERQLIALNLSESKDKSPKGTIDEPILPLLNLINSQPDWISTSSCSGRLVTYLPAQNIQPSSSKISLPSINHGKGGGTWLFVSHSTLSSYQLENPIQTCLGTHHHHLDSTLNTNHWSSDSSPIVHLVYQPPVLHLLARSVDVTIPILTSVIGAGFRNSGITVGHRGRVILAIRSSTGGLDVPIAIQKWDSNSNDSDSTRRMKLQLLVSKDYLSKLLLEGNQLMKQNEIKLQRLYQALFNSFNQSNLKLDRKWESTEERRQRMKLEGLTARAASITSKSTILDNLDCSLHQDIPELSLVE